MCPPLPCTAGTAPRRSSCFLSSRTLLSVPYRSGGGTGRTLTTGPPAAGVRLPLCFGRRRTRAAAVCPPSAPCTIPAVAVLRRVRVPPWRQPGTLSGCPAPPRLRDRRVRVELNAVVSGERVFRAGLPQGGVLSPSLFLLWAASLVNSLSAPSRDDPRACTRTTPLLCVGVRTSAPQDSAPEQRPTPWSPGRGRRRWWSPAKRPRSWSCRSGHATLSE